VSGTGKTTQSYKKGEKKGLLEIYGGHESEKKETAGETVIHTERASGLCFEGSKKERCECSNFKKTTGT